MTVYLVTVWMNAHDDNFGGYEGTHPVTTAADLRLRVRADSPQAAAEEAFRIGNRQGPDLDGHEWPSDVRSVSVGDLLAIDGHGDGRPRYLAVAWVGCTEVPEPANPRVPFAGQGRVTSREEA